MNWLIITDKTDGALEAAVAEQDSNAKVVTITNNEKALVSAISSVSTTEQCIVSAADRSFITEGVALLVGVLAGRSIPIYSTLSTFTKLNRLGGAVKFLKSDEIMVRFFSENMKHIKEQVRKKRAYQYLFDRGFPFNANMLAAHVAKGNIDVCKKYFDAGMSVDSENSEGTPLLNIAVRSEQIQLVKCLLDNGADVGAVSRDRGYTALMDAVWIGSEPLVKLLIERGSSMNVLNKEGQTMLVLAVGADRKNICKLLVEHGESPDIKDSMGMSAYSYAKLFRKQDYLDMFEKYHHKSGEASGDGENDGGNATGGEVGDANTDGSK